MSTRDLEWYSAQQAAEIDRLRTELAEEHRLRVKDNGMWVRRTYEAEAKLARVRELCEGRDQRWAADVLRAIEEQT